MMEMTVVVIAPAFIQGVETQLGMVPITFRTLFTPSSQLVAMFEKFHAFRGVSKSTSYSLCSVFTGFRFLMSAYWFIVGLISRYIGSVVGQR